jgi:hypothetical protein
VLVILHSLPSDELCVVMDGFGDRVHISWVVLVKGEGILVVIPLFPEPHDCYLPFVVLSDG